MENISTNVNFKINFAGFVSNADWQHFAWAVLVNGIDFAYKTGVGHATPLSKNCKRQPKPAESLIVECPEFYRLPGFGFKVYDEQFSGGKVWAHVPKQDDVLHCLFKDADAGTLSFHEFCDSFGYDADSIKALKTYHACQDIGDKLKKAFGTKYAETKEKYLAMEF